MLTLAVTVVPDDVEQLRQAVMAELDVAAGHLRNAVNATHPESNIGRNVRAANMALNNLSNLLEALREPLVVTRLS